MKKRYSEVQIIKFLREADAGTPVKDLCRRHGFSEASYYLWRGKFGGMPVSSALTNQPGSPISWRVAVWRPIALAGQQNAEPPR
jgi:putative transposase